LIYIRIALEQFKKCQISVFRSDPSRQHIPYTISNCQDSKTRICGMRVFYQCHQRSVRLLQLRKRHDPVFERCARRSPPGLSAAPVK
jgi:hypothetical protein